MLTTSPSTRLPQHLASPSPATPAPAAPTMSQRTEPCRSAASKPEPRWNTPPIAAQPGTAALPPPKEATPSRFARLTWPATPATSAASPSPSTPSLRLPRLLTSSAIPVRATVTISPEPEPCRSPVSRRALQSNTPPTAVQPGTVASPPPKGATTCRFARPTWPATSVTSVASPSPSIRPSRPRHRPHQRHRFECQRPYHQDRDYLAVRHRSRSYCRILHRQRRDLEQQLRRQRREQ